MKPFLYLKTLFRINSKKLSIQNPLTRKHSDYTKFIILTTPRTGSTLLHTYLNYHFHVLSLGESINDYSRPILWQLYPKSIKAVGYKIFYQFKNKVPVSFLLDQLQIQDDTKIIWLRRRNKLKQWISLKISQQTGEWSTLRQANTFVPIELEPTEFLTFLTDVEQLDKEVFEKISGKGHLSIFYEDLVDNYLLEMDKVWKFLGVQSIRTASLLRRQHPQLAKEMLTNHHNFSILDDIRIEKWLKE